MTWLLTASISFCCPRKLHAWLPKVVVSRRKPQLQLAVHQKAAVVKNTSMKKTEIHGIQDQNPAHSKTQIFSLFYRYKKPITITTAIVVLQLLFGWDIKFTIINLIWLLV